MNVIKVEWFTYVTPCTMSYTFHVHRCGLSGVLLGTPCVYGALIGWLVARMLGYLCPEASPPWRKRCFRKRGLPLSAEQSSTDPRARKVVGIGRARDTIQHVPIIVCACVLSIITRPLSNSLLPLFHRFLRILTKFPYIHRDRYR